MTKDLRQPPNEKVRQPRKGIGVTQEAIERIRERVASGKWGPGKRLPREADLAADLGL